MSILLTRLPRTRSLGFLMYNKVENFEIACYEALIVGAQQMGQDEAVDLLQRNLEWEQKTALDLKQKAPQLVQKAMQGS